MSLNFLIAPDFAPERFAGWHMFNTLLQKKSGISLHLLTPASYAEQSDMLDNQDIALVYANPFDASMLIREKGYRAIARPIGKADEMIIAAAANRDIDSLEALQAGNTIAMANNKDVKLIGLRLLEAVDLGESDLTFEITENYQAAARTVIKGEAEAGFFLAEVFNGLSKLTRAQMRVLIESDLADISHVILVKDDLEMAEPLTEVILSLKDMDEGAKVFAELGMPDGLEAMDEESAEFMIDLIETLLD